MSVRLGIVGAGGIGHTHVKAAATVAGVEVACIADLNADAAQALAKIAGGADAVDDPQKLFDSSKVDAVVVATPNAFHKDLAIAAMRAGKDVLVEKPMALCAADCQAVNTVAEKTNRILQVGFVFRYSPAAAAARKFIEAGRLGTIYHAKASWYRRRGIPGLGGWFTTKKISGGGPLIDLGVHMIDSVLYLMDQPTPVRVSGKTYAQFGKRMRGYVHERMWAGPPRYDGVCDVEDAAHALIRFDGGATFELNVTWAGNLPDDMTNQILLMGDKAGLTINQGGNELHLFGEDEGYNVDLTPKLVEVWHFEQQMRQFVHNVETRTAPHASGQCGQKVQSIIDAVYESSEKDREVEVGG
jgi:predicted dehydrogenase